MKNKLEIEYQFYWGLLFGVGYYDSTWIIALPFVVISIHNG